MKRFIYCTAALMCVATLSLAQDPSDRKDPNGDQSSGQSGDQSSDQSGGVAAENPATGNPAVEDPTQVDQASVWGLELGQVPDLLRLHVPMLGPKSGLVVTSVDPTGPAAKLGVRTGDILMEVDGRPVRRPSKLGRPDDHLVITVLRRGVPQMLATGGPAMRAGMPAMQPMPSMPAMQPMPDMPAMPSQSGIRFGGGTWSLAMSLSGQGEAVSVSRAGDQVSIDISSADPKVGRIKLSGTIAEIERQLEDGRFSGKAKAAIRKAIGD